MEPTNFPQANKVLTKPQDMTEEECGDLRVWSDGTTCVSLWKPTFRERLSILVFGNVWLHIVSGYTQPPVAVEGKRNIWTVKCG